MRFADYPWIVLQLNLQNQGVIKDYLHASQIQTKERLWTRTGIRPCVWLNHCVFTACLKNGRESYSERRRSSRDRKLWLVAVQWTRNLMTIFVLAFDNVFLRSSICLLTPLSHPKHPWTVDFPVYGMCLSQQYKLINFNVKTNQLIRSKRRKRRRSKFVLHIPELIIQPNASLPVQEITTQRVTNWGSSTKTKWRGAKTEWRRDRFVNHPDK